MESYEETRQHRIDAIEAAGQHIFERDPQTMTNLLKQSDGRAAAAVLDVADSGNIDAECSGKFGAIWLYLFTCPLNALAYRFALFGFGQSSHPGRMGQNAPCV